MEGECDKGVDREGVGIDWGRRLLPTINHAVVMHESSLLVLDNAFPFHQQIPSYPTCMHAQTRVQQTTIGGLPSTSLNCGHKSMCGKSCLEKDNYWSTQFPDGSTFSLKKTKITENEDIKMVNHYENLHRSTHILNAVV